MADIWTTLGIGLCIVSTVQSQLSNVLLKYNENLNHSLEEEGKPRMPWCNIWRIIYMLLEVVSSNSNLLKISWTWEWWNRRFTFACHVTYVHICIQNINFIQDSNNTMGCIEYIQHYGVCNFVVFYSRYGDIMLRRFVIRYDYNWSVNLRLVWTYDRR